MVENIKVPVGISSFREIRDNDFYYVDKTGLIADVLKKESTKVTLITRPRRFGKTLMMDMLENFFDIRKDSKSIFSGLEISKKEDLCNKWMNKYPTIFVSFKEIDGLTFQNAYDMLTIVISELFKDHGYLLNSKIISDSDKKIIESLIAKTASLGDVKNSLNLLTRVLSTYNKKPVILLIDEYDVPVAKANNSGYYSEMLEVMKGIMSALKDNEALKFAVITGCLKIAKESIFTGTNNFVSDTITSSPLNEYFGFTQSEVDKILLKTGLEKHSKNIKAWYDGYHFGKYDIYCPWDVMNYVSDLIDNPDAKPLSYWKNTSDNSIIRSFIDYLGGSITRKLETLLSGGYILERIDENLTYDFLHSSESNFWSILYLTGYLTQKKLDELNHPSESGLTALIIPNAEIREIFESTIVKWFTDSTREWNRGLLFSSLWSGDGKALEEEINKLLRKTISYHDYKEDFYHAFLAGIFAGAGYAVESNREHGDGRSDIVVYDTINARVAFFEIKYAKTLATLEKKCDEALKQIDERRYERDARDDFDDVLCYGISFFKKRCIVKQKQMLTR